MRLLVRQGLVHTDQEPQSAGSAVADGRAPSGMDQAAVVADIQANLIPDAVLIPAMVGEVSRAQDRVYSLIFVPAFRP